MPENQNKRTKTVAVSQASPRRKAGRPRPEPERMELSTAVVNSISDHIRSKNKARLNALRRPPRINGDELERRLVLGIRSKRGRSFSGLLWSSLKAGRRALSWEAIHNVGVRAHEQYGWFDSRLHYITSPLFLDEELRAAIEAEDAENANRYQDVTAQLQSCLDTLLTRYDWEPAAIVDEVKKGIARVQRQLREAEARMATQKVKGDPFAI